MGLSFLPIVFLMCILFLAGVFALWILRCRRRDRVEVLRIFPRDKRTREQLGLAYRGQLSKMLGLIAAWIATFVPMIVIFLDVARNPPLAVFARLVVGSLAVVLLAADVSLTLAILSKFQEIVILERELGVTRFYNGIRQYRFAGAALWDSIVRSGGLGIEEEEIERHDYSRMNCRLEIVSFLVIAILSLLCGTILAGLLAT